jgi:hypothetical protein
MKQTSSPVEEREISAEIQRLRCRGRFRFAKTAHLRNDVHSHQPAGHKAGKQRTPDHEESETDQQSAAAIQKQEFRARLVGRQRKQRFHSGAKI